MGLSTAFCIMRRIAAFYVHIKPGRKAYTSGKRSASGKGSASGKRSAYGNGSASGKRSAYGNGSASGKRSASVGSAYGEKSTAGRVKTAAAAENSNSCFGGSRFGSSAGVPHKTTVCVHYQTADGRSHKTAICRSQDHPKQKGDPADRPDDTSDISCIPSVQSSEPMIVSWPST